MLPDWPRQGFFCESTSHLLNFAMNAKISLKETLLQLLTPSIEVMGYELVDVEYHPQGQRRSLIRIYIDHEGGITLDDCQKVSHQASGLLDVFSPVSESYTLEVSSPGLDRPLTKPAHFRRVVGEKIRARLKLPFEGRRNFSGYLVDADDEKFSIRISDGQVVDLRYDATESVRVAQQMDPYGRLNQ